jgi:hypothetical protein
MLKKKEYTEEDTFNALRRPRIAEMREKVKTELGSWSSPPEMIKFLKQYNWKLTEYIAASKGLDL